MNFVFKKIGLGIVPLVLLVALIAIKTAVSYYTFGASAEFSRWLFVISAGVSVLCIYFACRSYSCFKLYSGIILAVFAASCCLELVFSPIDECAHFEYAAHILGTGTLPVIGDQWSASAINSVNFGDVCPGYNHEAAQAPVYYLFLAAFGSFIGNNALSLVVYRITGLILAVSTAVISSRLSRVLFGASLSDSPLLRLLILLTVLSPGYLYRAARLNNEIMVCFLFVVLLYQFFLTFIDNRTYRYWLVSLLAVLLFLTKNTAVYGMVLPFLLFVFHIRDRRIRITVPLSLALSGLLTLPWFAFNLANYHALTGMKKHFEYAVPIVNPHHVSVDFVDAFFNMLPVSFYNGEELALRPVAVHFVSCAYILFLIIFCALAYRTASRFFSFRKNAAGHSGALQRIPESAAVWTAYFAVILLAVYYLYSFTADLSNTPAAMLAAVIACLALFFVFSIVAYRLSIKAPEIRRISVQGFDPMDRKNLHLIVNIACLAVVFAATAVLVSGSVVSTICAVRGRYFYPVVPAICMLFMNSRESFAANLRKPLTLVAVLMLSLVSADVTSGLIVKSMWYRGWMAAGAAEVRSSDLTDDHWLNGVSRDGKMILLDYSPDADYSLMRGRLLSSGSGEYAWIDREEYAGKYEHLYLKNIVDPQKVSGDSWKNLGIYTLRRYNLWGGRTALGKINGMRLSQSFRIKSDSALGFSLMSATYGEPSVSLTVGYRLIEDGSGKVITEGSKKLYGVNDNQWIEVLFWGPVQVVKDGRYILELTVDSPDGRAVTFYASTDDVYKDGELSGEVPGLRGGLDLKFGIIQR